MIAAWGEVRSLPMRDSGAPNNKINNDEKFITIKGEGEFGTIEYGYSIIENIEEKKCLELTPNIGSKCLRSYLVKAGDYLEVLWVGI